MFHDRVGHAGAAVGDGERDEAAAGVGVAQFLAHGGGQGVAGLGAKVQAPALGHGVARVDGDVQQRRFELARVGAHGGAGVVGVDLDLDALVERAAQHVGERVQHLPHVDRVGLQHLAPREGQQLARELGAAPAGARGGGHELLRVAVGRELRQLFEHLQVALDDGEQVVEVVRDAAGELAHALQALRVVQRLLGLHALQAGGEQAGHRFEKANLLVAEAPRGRGAHRQHAGHAAPVGQRHGQCADQAGLEVSGRHGEAALFAVVRDHDGAALREHVAGLRVGPVGDAQADAFVGDQAHAAGQAELALAAVEQPHHRHLDLQRGRDDVGHLRQHHLQVARVDRQPAQLGQVFAVTRALQRLLHARVSADVADRGHHEGQALVLQRAQRDLDHHLAAVLALGDELHVGAHRARARRAAVGFAECRVARADAVGHQRFHAQAHELVGRVAEHGGGRGVGQHDAARLVDHQQRIGVGGEQRAEHAAFLDARGQAGNRGCVAVSHG
ncbi:hypothetical protein D3C72_1014570 [compost metagenome]